MAIRDGVVEIPISVLLIIFCGSNYSLSWTFALLTSAQTMNTTMIVKVQSGVVMKFFIGEVATPLLTLIFIIMTHTTIRNFAFCWFCRSASCLIMQANESLRPSSEAVLDFYGFAIFRQFILIFHLKNVYLEVNITNICQIEAVSRKCLILAFCNFHWPTFWKWPQGHHVSQNFRC